ncbi:MAG: Si-specific NAD(P)(+) transhydrogenase [Rubinisphaera brasiliensis]|uniref:Soluble pyridine nucleotide transhydrogenase n=1 Tax=Rubinisphaera brasiliensis (strain ATCC 49424 / DSM 5305 / JCM 21570 / IAM 15109 / NBRC 103401 / IFAM 1448) TaxID=756272 RepID=F0SLW2_RUBBR|nr:MULTISPECIES: Si-specific NAD(P)(+) transhydrogenase [Rubinisphaera]ADY59887.1 NAD(P)(+) transhydrogenase (B-specific) [Rubinisphaera brasiliensis DSM 5305]MBB03812.1 Si-specific NAD(P)(+) transhydrogenase [Planctomyces sp.]MBR9802533.1 Si-specific NAD(P)(+) transhydrogenase [bacterium]
MNQYDLLVIGTGPGGEGAAMQACKEGKKVAVVERYSHIGGGCTHWGTIPSKALRHAIFRATELNSSELNKELGVSVKMDFPSLRRGAGAVINKQVNMRQGFYTRNRIDLMHGAARFVDLHTVEVCEENGGCQLLTADSFVIATGSRPYRPAGVDFDHPRVFDSDTILNMDYTPSSITIYGAGVIGCEYASMFRNIGCKVNLVNGRDQLLEFLDDEIIDALSYHLRDRGVLIRHREQYERIEPRDDGVILHLQSGKMLKTDILLWAAGRSGNSNDMGLENLDLVPNKRGHIEINDDFQTKHEHIYAVGDVIGPPSLASAAYVQGRYAASHLINGHADRAMIEDIPTGIYTSPEISSIGQTERELTQARIPYEVGHSMFKSIARAQITGQTVGMLKLLFHRETLEILGIHCFGANASEIIHIGQAIMSQQGSANSLKYFMNTTFNYPTMAEAYRVAALNGYNRLF